MGVVASPDDPAIQVKPKSNLLLYGATALYGGIVALTALRHEPWADEAQSWLLARDASLLELWTKLLHYEGTPGLWQTFLHVSIRLGLPYSGLNLVSAGLGLAASVILIWFAPLPLAIRLSLPFSYFLCYQYSVIARSYCLLPLLLFLTAWLVRDPIRHLWTLTALLILTADVSVHGFVISLAIAISTTTTTAAQNFQELKKRRFWGAAVVYAMGLVLIALSAIPAIDGTFVTRPNFSVGHLLDVATKTFKEAFTGEPLTSFGLVALSLPFLWRGGGWLMFVLSSVLLCGVNAVIYSQVWHMGLLFLAWVFAFWISAIRTKMTRLALAAMLVTIAVQCYCTAKAIRYDWARPYSGSLAAANFLKSSGIPGHSVYGIGYACVAIQPYFDRNLFANFQEGKGPAFWDWSKRNRSLKDLERIASFDPEFVVVGYTGLAEKILWSHDVKRSGYDPIGHFEGNLFWRTEILEPATFDVYQRRRRP